MSLPSAANVFAFDLYPWAGFGLGRGYQVETLVRCVVSLFSPRRAPQPSATDTQWNDLASPTDHIVTGRPKFDVVRCRRIPFLDDEVEFE